MSIWKLTTLALAGLLLTACSQAPSASPGVAAIGDPSSTATSAPPAGKGLDQALKYSDCMRRNGVPSFPDPQQTDGGASINIGKDSGIDPESPQFKAAENACASLRPGGDDNANPLDPTKISAWTACIRAHGVPNFPDPTNNGNAMQLDLTGLGISQSQLQTAISACQDKSPGGGLMIKNGNPGSSR
jgi:hypothetical protein